MIPDAIGDAQTGERKKESENEKRSQAKANLFRPWEDSTSSPEGGGGGVQTHAVGPQVMG